MTTAYAAEPAFVPSRDHEGIVVTEGGVWVYLHSFPAGWWFVDWNKLDYAQTHGTSPNTPRRIAYNVALGLRCGSYQR